MNNESVNYYLARFRQMRSRCFTSIPEPEIVKIVTGGLGYYIRKKLDNQHFVGLAQLGEKIRQIEQLKAQKVFKQKKFLKRENINVVGCSDSDKERK